MSFSKKKVENEFSKLFYVWSLKVNQRGAKRKKRGEGRGVEPNPDLKQLRFTFGGNLRKLLEVFSHLLDPLYLPCQFEVFLLLFLPLCLSLLLPFIFLPFFFLPFIFLSIFHSFFLPFVCISLLIGNPNSM